MAPRRDKPSDVNARIRNFHTKKKSGDYPRCDIFNHLIDKASPDPRPEQEQAGERDAAGYEREAR